MNKVKMKCFFLKGKVVRTGLLDGELEGCWSDVDWE